MPVAMAYKLKVTMPIIDKTITARRKSQQLTDVVESFHKKEEERQIDFKWAKLHSKYTYARTGYDCFEFCFKLTAGSSLPLLPGVVIVVVVVGGFSRRGRYNTVFFSVWFDHGIVCLLLLLQIVFFVMAGWLYYFAMFMMSSWWLFTRKWKSFARSPLE